MATRHFIEGYRTKPLAKEASVFKSLRKMTSGKNVKGLYGPKIARKAREHGVIHVVPDDFVEFGGKRVANKNVMKASEVPPDFKGVVVDMGAAGTEYGLKKKVPGAHVLSAQNVNLNKLQEMQMLQRHVPEYVPRTEGLGDIVQQEGLRSLSKRDQVAEIKRVLKTRYPEGYMIKGVEDAATLAGDLPTEKTSLAQLRKALHRKKIDNYLVQERREMMPTTKMDQLTDKAILSLPMPHPEKPGQHRLQNLARNTEEYRVHAARGKVIPGATTMRGGTVRGMIPSELRYAPEAEKTVAEVMSKLPKRYQKGFYGFDVGIDSKGKPFIIEMNPTNQGGASGYLTSPMFTDAVTAAIKGKTSGMDTVKDTGKAILTGKFL